MHSVRGFIGGRITSALSNVCDEVGIRPEVIREDLFEAIQELAEEHVHLDDYEAIRLIYDELQNQTHVQWCGVYYDHASGPDSEAEVRNPWFGVDVAFLNRVDCDYRGYILEKRPKHCRNRAHRIRLGILQRFKKKQTIKASSIEKLGPKENRDLKVFEIEKV